MTQHTTIHADLDLFAVVWNQMQNQTTPPIHLQILRWLETSYQTLDTRLLLMAFRACGKSSLVGIYCAWLLHVQPNLRIMVMAADDSLARKMVRNVRRILEKHPLCHGLIPQKADQWASDRFTINRTQELRDPSMMARGVTSNITGARADIIIYDDVEVPNTSNTSEAREDLRHRLDESRFILTPQGTQLFVGTPHHFDTIYQTDKTQQKTGQSQPYLDGFQSMIIPILNQDNQSAWPERFDIDNIMAMKKQVGPNKFASQMMLQPTNIAEGRLNPDHLKIYDTTINYKEVMQKPILSINGKQMVSCSAWWDPAFGSATGDASVWAVIFSDMEGHYYLHHIDYIRIADLNGTNHEDEATQQCRHVAQLMRQFYVPCVTIEINGIGRFLPAILRRELRAMGVQASVIEHSNRTPKSQRILESFDAVMAAQSLYIHQSVTKTTFMQEMREWRPTGYKGHDDGLDAVAGALAQEPIRIAAGALKGKPSGQWKPNAQIFTAKT